MWVFIATEILLFGGLILAATSPIGTLYPAAFAAASRHTEIVIGAANTAILRSSLPVFLVACAVDASFSVETRKLCITLLSGAILLGLAFIVLKGVEYSIEYREHLVPGIDAQLRRGSRQRRSVVFSYSILSRPRSTPYICWSASALLANTSLA